MTARGHTRNYTILTDAIEMAIETIEYLERGKARFEPF